MDQMVELYRLHCECVRRNPTYKEHYAEYRRVPDDPQLLKALAQRDLVNRWGVLPGDFPDPDQRPPLMEILSSPVSWPEEVLRYIAWRNADPMVQQAMDAFLGTFVNREVDSKDVAGMIILMYFPEENLQHPTYMTFNMRWSKKDLMAAFEDWVDSSLYDRERAGLKQETQQKRIRRKECLTYLRVYDLRTTGLTFPQIERQLRGDSAMLGRSARDQYVKGNALVINPPLLPQPHQGLCNLAPTNLRVKTSKARKLASPAKKHKT